MKFRTEDFFNEQENKMYARDFYGMNNENITGVIEHPKEETVESIPLFTEQEQIAIDTALTVEYIACLLEANLG